jgi:hypothetical protein
LEKLVYLCSPLKRRGLRERQLVTGAGKEREKSFLRVLADSEKLLTFALPSEKKQHSSGQTGRKKKKKSFEKGFGKREKSSYLCTPPVKAASTKASGGKIKTQKLVREYTHRFKRWPLLREGGRRRKQFFDTFFERLLETRKKNR